jgi:uncharacterized DUF497 family protein
MTPSFEWDKNKASANERKHGVTFQEAATVFIDELAAVFVDEDHSDDEDREIIVGNSIRNRLLIVSFTERGDAIRIISARKATKRERKDFENNTRGGQ